VKVEEDTTLDKEVNHTSESVDFVVFAANGLLTASGGVIQPTPVPSPTPRTPVPTISIPTYTPTPTPTPTDTLEPTPTPTDTPAPTLGPTWTPTWTPTYTPLPITPTVSTTNTPAPTAGVACSSIMPGSLILSGKNIYLLVMNLNTDTIYLTSSNVEWPGHGDMYLKSKHFNWQPYFTEGDFDSPTYTVVDPPLPQLGNTNLYWYAAYENVPPNWMEGFWEVTLTFNGACEVRVTYNIPTAMPTAATTPTFTPSSN
jgi:hypothetical protein